LRFRKGADDRLIQHPAEIEKYRTAPPSGDPARGLLLLPTDFPIAVVLTTLSGMVHAFAGCAPFFCATSTGGVSGGRIGG
jgi:hypothetical protein